MPVWPRHQLTPAGVCVSMTLSCQRGPTPAVQGLSDAFLPLVFPPLPVLFFLPEWVWIRQDHPECTQRLYQCPNTRENTEFPQQFLYDLTKLVQG